MGIKPNPNLETWVRFPSLLSTDRALLCFVYPFDVISTVYANIQYPLCSVALISFTPSFIKIRLNLTEKKQFKEKMTDDESSSSQPISCADLWSQRT